MLVDPVVRHVPVPFSHWVLDGLLSRSSAVALTAALLEARKDQDGWTAYDNKVERKKTCRDLAHLPGVVRELFLELLDLDFCDRLQSWLGLSIDGLRVDRTLHGGGVHLLEAGGYLGPHLDYALHPHLRPPMERRLNLLLYLPLLWQANWGGATNLYADDGATVVRKVYPELGRALAWESSDLAYHGTQRVAGDCPQPRLTAAVYFVAPARPAAVRKRALFVPER